MRVNNKEKGYKINSFGRMAVCVCVVFLVAMIFAAGIYPPSLADAREGHYPIQQYNLEQQSQAAVAGNGRSGTSARTSGMVATNASSFAGGDGTAEEPFLISTPQQLDNMRQFVGGDYAGTHFRLYNDIDLYEFLSLSNAGFNDGAGWLPIGANDYAFLGHFDGGGHTISNLWIYRPEQRIVGLFSAIHGNISNLNIILDERGIVGYSMVGAISGFAGNISDNAIVLQNLSVKGNVYGKEYIGGLFGRIASTTSRYTIKSSQFIGNVSAIDLSIPDFTRATSSIVGGIAGAGFNITIRDSLVRADIHPYADASFILAGGFVGWFQGQTTTIDNSFVEMRGYADFQPFFGTRLSGFGLLPQATVYNSFFVGEFEGGHSAGVELREYSGQFVECIQLAGWDFTHTWGFDKDGNLVLRIFGQAYDPTRTVIINITGTGAEGVTHDAPATILQTETTLQFTLTGVAYDATITLPDGATISGMTVTIPITAGEAVLILDIVITAYVPPPPDLTWLWILLGIIGGIVLIGGAVFLALKLRKPKTITEMVEVEKEVIVERETVKEVPIIKKPLPSDLSDREKEVATLVLKGMSRSKIALKMDIAESTITTYMERIYIKSGVDNQKEFVARFTGDA